MKTFTITKEHIDWNGRYIGPDPKFDAKLRPQAVAMGLIER